MSAVSGCGRGGPSFGLRRTRPGADEMAFWGEDRHRAVPLCAARGAGARLRVDKNLPAEL